MTIAGTNFPANATVSFGGAAGTGVQVQSPTQLTVTTPAHALGPVDVTVTDPVKNLSGTLPGGFIYTETAPVITMLSHTTAVQGGLGFLLTVTGSNYQAGSTVRWSGTPLSSTVDSATQIRAFVGAAQLTMSGNFPITVATPSGTVSNAVQFQVTGGPVINNLIPPSIPAGSLGFVLTVQGSNFSSTSIVRWSGLNFTTRFISGATLEADVPAEFIAAPGTATITVVRDGSVSNGVPFQVTQAGPSITALSPETALAGGPAFTLAVTGANFTTAAKLLWNGNERATTAQDPSHLTAQILASDITTAGTAAVSILIPNVGTSNPATFRICTAPGCPQVDTLSPDRILAGGPDFTLTVFGQTLIAGSVVRFNGADRATTRISDTELRATILAADIPASGPGVATITVARGASVSNQRLFTICKSPCDGMPTITSIDPPAAEAGGAAFTLTVNGTNFSSASKVRWNGTDRPTTFTGDSTRLTASIPASDISTPGTASVTVVNGSQVSAAKTFTITCGAGCQAPPSLTTLSPNVTPAGGGNFTLTVNGSGFTASSVARWNGDNRPTTFGSATQITAAITAQDIASPGRALVTVANGVSVSGAQSVIVSCTSGCGQAPAISIHDPREAASGGSAFQLNLTGLGFGAQSVVRWNGSDRATTLVNSKQLTAAIPASDLVTPGMATFLVADPNGISASREFRICDTTCGPPPPPPPPTITGLDPAGVPSKGPAFTLTVDGTNFTSTGSSVNWNGNPRPTTYVSATRLTAAIPGTDVGAAGTASITVTTPGGTSAAWPFTICSGACPAPPSITTLSPPSLLAGSGGVTLVVDGAAFAAGSTVRWNGGARNTTFVSATRLRAVIPASDLATAGVANVTVVRADGFSSAAQPFTICASGCAASPAISGLSPHQVASKSGLFTLTVNGSGFGPGSVVRWNDEDRATTFVSGTQVTAQITGTDVTNAGTYRVTVTRDGIISAPATFTVCAGGCPLSSTVVAGDVQLIDGSGLPAAGGSE